MKIEKKLKIDVNINDTMKRVGINDEILSIIHRTFIEDISKMTVTESNKITPELINSMMNDLLDKHINMLLGSLETESGQQVLYTIIYGFINYVVNMLSKKMLEDLKNKGLNIDDIIKH